MLPSAGVAASAIVAEVLDFLFEPSRPMTLGDGIGGVEGLVAAGADYRSDIAGGVVADPIHAEECGHPGIDLVMFIVLGFFEVD